MRESITKLDLNFSNAGGGHTASITTIMDGKTLGGEDGLGTVMGPAGDVNDFSNADISTAMARFICTQVSISASPTRKMKTRRYSDRTSLLLDSIIVLVRGIGCGPEGGEAERSIAYYSEVINTPLQPFKSMGPKREGSVIEVGRIYNQEAAAAYSGVKMSLVYNNKELKKPLCLNLDHVSDTYEEDPDLSQYELKFGYTLKDFSAMLSSVGVPISGLPINESVLFETSGTLSSVISSVASYLGFFWYIDPLSGGVMFVDTQTASAYPVTDYTGTEDSNIINASFTESVVTNKIVNIYNGTTERKEPQSNPADSAIRSRKAYFKSVHVEGFEGFKQKISEVELGTFFSLFNQGVDTATFDFYTYVVALLAAGDPTKLATELGEDWDDFDMKNLYTDYPYPITPKWSFMGEETEGQEGGPEDNPHRIYPHGNKVGEIMAGFTNLKKYPNRQEHNFVYYKLIADPTDGKMERPSKSDLYTFLKAYFEIAGGVYVSNGYSTYKADRMQFTNSNTVTVCGPYEGKEEIGKLEELSALNDIYDLLNIEGPTVKELAEQTNGKAQVVNNNFFIALKSLPKLQRRIGGGAKVVKKVDFSPFLDSTEYLDNIEKFHNALFIGGPSKMWQNVNQIVLDMIEQSHTNYIETIKQKDSSIAVAYQRSKTRVNRLSDDGEEDEDDKIANSSGDDQKKSDLFDRFDMRYWGIEKPKYSFLNKLSLSGSSGTTVEMVALRATRGNYHDGTYRPKSSSRTLYGLSIPEFSPTLNSISLSFGANGITTTVNESTVKLIPLDQSFLQTRGMEAFSQKSTLPKAFSAVQRNKLGL